MAGPAGGELEDEVAGLARGAQRGPGVAELVVERAGRRDGRAQRLQQVRDEVLGRRLARRAGDADDGAARPARGCRRRGAPARPARPAPRRRRRRRRRRARRSWRCPTPAARSRRRVDLAGGEHPGGAGRRRPASAKSCPSTRSPGRATNSPPGSTARVSNSTEPVTRSSPVGAVQPAAGDMGDLGEGQLDHRGPPWLAARRSSSSTSENGSFSAATCWPVSWPLPAIDDDVARARLGHGRGDGGAAVADLVDLAASGTARAPSSIAARIAAGSSVRGLSSVTQRWSASWAPAGPSAGAWRGRGRRRSRAR